MLSTSIASSDKGPAFGQPLLGSSPHRLTLRMNFLWTLAGNVVYAACQWGILVVLAKLGTLQTGRGICAGSGNHSPDHDWRRAVTEECPGDGRGV